MISNLKGTKPPLVIDVDDLMDYCAVLDPSQATLIQALAQTAQDYVQDRIGDFLVYTPITWVIAKGEMAQDDYFFRSFLSSGTGVFGFGTNQGQWINLPTGAQSITGVTAAMWGADDVTLTEGVDFFADITTDPARIQMSFNYNLNDLYRTHSHMVISYIGGIAPDTSSIPTTLTLAIKEMTKRMYKNRGADEIGLTNSFIDSLLDLHQRFSFGVRP
ncbi:phage gp6-like head-tail connector protein [Gluconacetobacter tumulicola]|uniref:Phage gp6-like head-tail connector protein n=1 Tax=Gluconacetobacter tumulicola TaxID=1017177 RepID=A0A7W4JH85_9PROT|nr:phage gp6-like head-tail connector protein [Gluconacetobacter tumulicola]MBB2181231.1 phage gp6-like head-tail connector protein [Gluconacetobacter tumulicola]